MVLNGEQAERQNISEIKGHLPSLVKILFIFCDFVKKYRDEKLFRVAIISYSTLTPQPLEILSILPYFFFNKDHYYS